MVLSDEHIIYLVLKFLTFLIFIFSGKKMSKSKTDTNYWKIAFFPIVAFTLNEGLRWGRGVDYNLYYNTFEQMVNTGLIEGFEPLWTVFIYSIGVLLGLPWQIAVIMMSFFLIWAALFFFKDYRDVLMYVLPLFYIVVNIAETLARWYFAFSFVLLGMALMNKKKIFWYLCLIGAVAIHYGFIINVLLFYFIEKWKKPILNPYVSLIMMLGMYVLFQPEFLGGMLGMFKFLGNVERYEKYEDNLDYWLTGEGNEYSGISLTVFAIYAITIFYGRKLLSEDNTKLTSVYNFAVVGMILSPALLQIELGVRICSVLSFFYVVIFGYILKQSFSHSNNKGALPFVFAFLFLLLILRLEIQKPFELEKDEVLYIWDSKGRGSL